MPKYNDFGHLPIPLVLKGKSKLQRGSGLSPRTYANRQNRVNHGNYMKRRTTGLSRFWKERAQRRIDQGLPQIKKWNSNSFRD